MGIINQNVNNIIFFKLREVSKSDLGITEDIYFDMIPASYSKNDLTFLEEDIINSDPHKFYKDLGDFAMSANSLEFDKERKLWNTSAGESDKILYNKLGNLIERKMKLPDQDDEISSDFFQSDYFEQIIKESYSEYYKNWIALKEIKEKYGDDSLVYKAASETWKKDEKKLNVETKIKELLKKRIQDLWDEKEEIKNKIDINTTTIITKPTYDIVATAFNPKNFYSSNSEWTHYKISKDEIKNLIDSNTDEFKIPKNFDNDIISIEFECCFLNVFRDWLHHSFLESPLWISEGAIETYPKKLMFIRNVKYTQKQHQDIRPINTNFMLSTFLSPMFLSPINFKTAGKNDAHKAYLSRNADKKAKTSILKKVTPNSLKLNLQPNLNLEHYELKTRRARVGRNPVTGKIINIKAKHVLRLKKQNNYKISVFSNTRSPLSDITIKLTRNGKEIKEKIKKSNHIIEFKTSQQKGYFIEILHPKFESLKIELKETNFQKKSNVYTKTIYLNPKNILETYALEEDTFLLLGCIGKTVKKDNNPIEGINYY
ncbi:HU family DNA-binding protein [uncultured Winogradskyella sp.]|uniref:HU family DNA-binding protein n=1 Tax=uncultured Winogradskyella sp. TaxID=395353 RepID=UPI00262D62CE|nr:HU family DNA-binding protein [uncultured Winogradskyella sp.]